MHDVKWALRGRRTRKSVAATLLNGRGEGPFYSGDVWEDDERLAGRYQDAL